MLGTSSMPQKKQSGRGLLLLLGDTRTGCLGAGSMKTFSKMLGSDAAAGPESSSRKIFFHMEESLLKEMGFRTGDWDGGLSGGLDGSGQPGCWRTCL